MIPSTDERLASIVRALTDIVMPALPPEAGLAREQVELTLGHLQILRAQFDAIIPYEAEELADARALGETLIGVVGATQAAALAGTMRDAAGVSAPAAVRTMRIAIHAAAADLIQAVASGGGAAVRSAVTTTVLDHEKRRVAKDRAWFAPFGFDIGS